MKQINKKLQWSFVLFMSTALIVLYPASILTMGHDAMNMTAPAHADMMAPSITDHSPASDPEQCKVFHLNLLETLTSSTPQTPNSTFFPLAILFLSLIGALLIKLNFRYLDKAVLFKLQRLKPISLKSFQASIGDWLNIIQKKDPAYAFAIA